MRKKSADEKIRILLGLLKGETYEEVALQNDASNSTVNQIAEDFRREMPDFHELRELKIRLRKAGLSASTALREIKNRENNTQIILNICDDEEERFQEKNLAAEYLAWALANRTVWIACKNCRNSFPVPLAQAQFYRAIISTGNSLTYVCPHCRLQSWYNPYEVLGLFGLTLLEKDRSVFSINLKLF
jgi:hypothetical protein